MHTQQLSVLHRAQLFIFGLFLDLFIRTNEAEAALFIVPKQQILSGEFAPINFAYRPNF